MESKLEMELEVRTELSPVELASNIAQVIREALEAMCQSLGTELAFEMFLVLDGREVRFVMEPT